MMTTEKCHTVGRPTTYFSSRTRQIHPMYLPWSNVYAFTSVCNNIVSSRRRGPLSIKAVGGVLTSPCIVYTLISAGRLFLVLVLLLAFV